MELRHQHKNERDVSADSERKKDEPEVRPQWPGKKTLTGAQPGDARSPDLKRIRAAIGALRGGGTSLPGAMTREYSQLLGLDLSDVRLHRGGAASAAAASLDATAFTHGSDIAIADHLDLDSAFGRHVIAHELVHVAQNKRSGGPGMELAAHAEVGPSGSSIEQEAERGASALTRGMSFIVGAHSRLPSISRFGNDENPPTGAASPVAVPGTNPPPVDSPVRAQVATPGSQPTPAQPAATPAPAPTTPAATPAPQPRPGTQPTSATPTAPTGTPGVNAPSGSGAAPNPATPASREPRPAAAPRTTGSPTPAVSLDDRVRQELETRADPTLKAGYARAVAGVDALRVQALQFSFTPNGVWNTLVETFTAKNAFQDHFGQIYSTNAYRGGNSWADTAQTWIEGLRGVVHIIGDVASVVSAWAGLAALVTGALALILSETVIGGIALGAIAVIAAEIAMVAGAVKLLTDIIDTILGVIQMIILIVRARNSKDPAARARFAQLLHKEANDFGANVVSIGVQVAVMAVSAGIGAGLSRGANSFISSFRSEFTRMITPALKPWTLGANVRGIANMMRPAAAGSGVRTTIQGRNLRGQAVPRTVLNAEVNAGLIGVNRQLRVGNRITAARETIPFTAANQMRGARLVLLRRALISNLIVNTGGFKIGFGAAQLQADIKQPRDFNRGGTSGSSPSANGGRLDVPQAAGSDLSKVQMWPSQIEAFENAKGPIQGTTDRTQRQYEMAEAQAGPELSAQVRTAFQGATNSAGQMRFGAMAVQTDAQEGQANTQRGLQQTQQAGQQRDQMGAQQSRASTSVNRISSEGAKLQSPPPREGVLGWLYNQTIGRIGGWIGSAQRWVMNLVGKWAMSLAGFSKEEMDIAGIENDMREDDKKDQNSSQEAQDAALKADQIQQTVFQLQENKTRDEQYAIQGMADAQRFIQALEDADRQLAAAISNGQAYIGQISPMIAHELQTEEQEAAIDEAYIAPVSGGILAFTNSIDGANVGDSARQQGIEQLTQMKAAFPELDISTGTSAIGTAVQTYTTAFGTLAGSARTQAGALTTALQAFIGTQDYDGVTANAASLETLAADFHRQAAALETQLFAAVQSVIDQYVTHIINAVAQAQQLPDEPDEEQPTDQPPVQRKALSSAPVISVQRKALTNAAPPQQQTAEAKVPTDINNPAPAAAPVQTNAGDNANAQTPAAATEATTASANGAQVPGAAPNGATASNPKDGLVGGASNTTDSPATAAKSKPPGATPKQQANPAGADKAPVESENEAETSIANASAGSGAGSNGSDNASAPGAAPDKPKTRRDDEPATETAAAGPTAAPPSSNGAAPTSKSQEPADKKDSNDKAAAAAPTGGNEVSEGAAPMVSGSTIEDGWNEKDQNKPGDQEAKEAETEQVERHASEPDGNDNANEAVAEAKDSESTESSETETAPTSDEPSVDTASTGFAVQRRSFGAAAATSSPVEVATQATAGSGGALPYLDTIQSAFGEHDVSSIRSHAGSAAEAGAAALNAKAFAVGDAVAFGASPDLHTAAHEAAHVVQQRAGLAPSGGIDSGSGDSLEQHADRVADAVVAGRSAQSILDQLVGGSSRGAATAGVSRKGAAPTVTSETAANPEGAAATRTTVGVGEVVKLTSTAAGTWTASAGTANGAENTEFSWTAPGKPGSAVIRVKTKDGEATKEFAVVGPSKVTFKSTRTNAPARDDMMGVGMMLDMTVHAAGDAKVSFQNMTIREQQGGASNTSGYFAGVAKSGREDLTHYPFGKDASGKANAPAQTAINSKNEARKEDEATLMDDESQPWARPFSVGSMTWQIPYLYSCGEVSDQSFTIATQTMSIVDSKVTVTITKGTASASRTPKQPVWQPPNQDEPKKAPASKAAPKAAGAPAAGATGFSGARGEGGNTAVGDTAKAAGAKAAPGKITHQTQATAKDNADNARVTVGVGEIVTFTSDQKGTWKATAVGPTGKATGKSASYEWIAPTTAQSVTITLDQGTATQTVQMTVVAPTGLDFTKTSEYTKIKPEQQGAGMVTDVHFLPFTVSFGRTKWKEIGGPGSNASGYYAAKGRKLPTHKPNPKWLAVDDSNGNIFDTAAFFGHPAPWTEGSFDWVIPNHYQVSGESGPGHEFTKVTQTCTIQDSQGTTVVTKGNASSSPRTPTAPSKNTKAKSAGHASGALGKSTGESSAREEPRAGDAGDEAVEGSPERGMLAEMAASFGADFSSVQVHHGDGVAESMGAEAAVQGDNVHVAAHRSPEDRQLIAHELAHVVQQREGRVESGPGLNADPALEAEADRAGEAVASGQAVPAEMMSRGGAVRISDAPVQLNRDPLKGIDAYLKVNEVHIWSALRDHLTGVPWPEPHPDVSWTNDRKFGALVWASLKDHLFLDEPDEIRRLVFPAQHRDVLSPYLPQYTRTWLPGLGKAFAELMEDAARASLRRLGPRYAGAAEHGASGEGDVTYSELTLSHPMDHHVARSIVQRGIVQYSRKAGKPDKATKQRPPKVVTLEWQGSKDPSLWNWVKAPSDATVEDVALTLFPKGHPKHSNTAGSEMAYGLTEAPPLYGVMPGWATTFPEAKKFEPSGAVGPESGIRMVALAASKVDDEIALAQSPAGSTKAPTPKVDALKTTLGDSLIAAAYLHRVLTPWNQAPAIKTVLDWIKEKQSKVITMPAKELDTWGPIIDGQKDRLLRVVTGVKAIVDKTAALGVKDAKSPNAKPLMGVMDTFAQAAALSHLADTGEQLLAQATQQQQQLAILMLRGVTNDMNNAVGVAAGANQRNLTDLAAESVQVAADSRTLQNQLAAGLPVDAGALQETTLHAQEIAFKTRVQGLFWSVRSLKAAVAEAGDGLASHVARTFHGSFKTLQQAILPVEGTINEIVLNQQSDDAMAAGNWETAAEQREYRSKALTRNQALLDQLTNHTNLVEFLREGADTVKWQHFAKGCVQMLALIGISIVAGAAGGAVVRTVSGALTRVGSTAAVAQIAEGGGMLARAGSVAARGAAHLAGAATEGAIITAAQVKMQGGSAGDAFFTNLLQTIGANAIMGTLTKDMAITRSIEMRTAAHWTKRAGKFVLKETVAVSAHTIMNVAIGYLAHMIVTHKNPTTMMAREWIMQGIATGLGRYTGSFMKARRGAHQDLAKLPEAMGGKRLLTAGDDLVALAAAAEANPTAQAVHELLAKRYQVLEQELQALELIDKNPDVLKSHPSIKLNIKDVRAAISALRAEKSAMQPEQRQFVLESAGLEEIVPGSEYRGSAEQMRRAIEAARAIGLPVGKPTTSAGKTVVKLGDVEVTFHEGAPTANAPPKRTPEEQFVEDIRSTLKDGDEKAHFDDIAKRRTPEQIHKQYKGDVENARKSIGEAAARDRAQAAAAAKSLETAELLREWVKDRRLMEDQGVLDILARHKEALAEAKTDAARTKANQDVHRKLRSYLVTERVASKMRSEFHGPGYKIRKDVLIMQEQVPPAGEGPYTSVEDYKARRANELRKSGKGVRFVDTPNGKRIYLEVTDIDVMVTKIKAGKDGKEAFERGEEVKTGGKDTHLAAAAQQKKGFDAIKTAREGGEPIKLFENLRTDITGDIDLGSVKRENMKTRGTAGKRDPDFDGSLDITSEDLDALVTKLLPPPAGGSK